MKQQMKKYVSTYGKWVAFVLVGALVIGAVVMYRREKPPTDVMTVQSADFVQQVNVSGTVVAAHTVDLSFALGGRVTHVYTQVGSTVKEGAVLAEVENGDLRAQVLQRQAALDTQRARLASLKQGTRPEQIAVTQSSVESARVALSQAHEAVLNAIHDGYTAADSAVHNTIDPMVDNVRINPQLKFPVTDTALKLTFESDRRGMDSMLTNWKDLDATTDAAHSLEAAATAQSYLTQTSTLIADANAALNHAIAGVNASQTTIDTWITAVGAARTSIDTRTSALTAAVTAAKAAQSALATAEKTLALQNAGTLQSDVDAQEAQVKAAEADVQNAQSQLAKTMIKAPFSGVITKIDAKVGQVAAAGTPLVSLMSKGTYQIECYVPEVNIAALAVGNRASTTLDAYGPTAHFGATVISIDPAQTLRDGVSTYKTTLQFNQEDTRIRPGMTADVTIVSGIHPNAIIIPQGAIITRNGQKYVTVLHDGSREERHVQTGATVSLGQVEILAGLTAGEVIVLSAK